MAVNGDTTTGVGRGRPSPVSAGLEREGRRSAPRPRRQPPRERAAHPTWFLLPALVVLGVFFFLPTMFNFVYAFTDWSGFKSEIGFVGFANFEALLENGTLLSSLRITLVYAVLVAVFQNVFGLLLALLLEHDTRINRFGRVCFFVPVVMSALAVGYIFQALLKPDGALNAVVGALLGREVTIPWLGSTTWTIVVVSLIHAWKWMGLSMLIYLAGLKTMPVDVLEAATIDGASRWKLFWSIRFPLLAPAVTFSVATALLGSMNGFDIVQATTEGGPARKTEILNIFIFRTFGQGLFAQATTMSLMLFLMVAVLAFPVIRTLRKREEIL
jgi:raffinose/stachyose/melibiose transport system permease protein